MRRIWYSLGYQILQEGRILRSNPPGRVSGGIAVLNEPHGVQPSDLYVE